MDVILLERIARLGQMGDVVRVRDGYARNFLLPQGKALRSTEAQPQALRVRAYPARGPQSRPQEGCRGGRRQAQRPDLRRHPPGRRDRTALRLGVAARPRRGHGEGRLQGRPQPGGPQPAPIKSIGLHPVAILLHPEVEASVTVNVARSEDEAERQARGEDLTTVVEEPTEEELGGGREREPPRRICPSRPACPDGVCPGRTRKALDAGERRAKLLKVAARRLLAGPHSDSRDWGARSQALLDEFALQALPDAHHQDRTSRGRRSRRRTPYFRRRQRFPGPHPDHDAPGPSWACSSIRS